MSATTSLLGPRPLTGRPQNIESSETDPSQRAGQTAVWTLCTGNRAEERTRRQWSSTHASRSGCRLIEAVAGGLRRSLGG